MTSVDDWLNDEQFDFDVTASPVGEHSNPFIGTDSPSSTAGIIDDDEDDEEVFFGPQTHKERCTAVVVTEKEQDDTPITPLNAEQQALILRESALLSIRIKHGTPASSKNSPIAVVHPMMREAVCTTDQSAKAKITNGGLNKNKENVGPSVVKVDPTTKTITEPIRTVTKQKNSKILQPKVTNKSRPSSQPELSTTKLPVSKSRAKIQPEFSEPLVDKVSLYGLNKTKPVRRRSGIAPAKAEPSDSEPNKTTTKPPTLLQSAIPSSRLKAPSSKSASTSELTIKRKTVQPMRVTGPTQVPHPTSLPQASLKFTKRKPTSSIGTPSSKSSGISASLKRRSLGGTPSRKGALVEENTTANQSEISGQKNLMTPVQRTPSRKSLAARKLVGKRSESLRAASPAEKCATTKTVRNTHSASSATNSIPITATDLENDVTTKSPTITRTVTSSNSPTETTTTASTHSDILARYKKLCKNNNNNNSKNISSNATDSNTKPRLADETTAELHKNQDSAQQDESRTVDEQLFPGNPIMKNACSKVATLVDVNVQSPLLKMSPLKTPELSLDPFHTGATPPPLIDVVDVLEPERASEVNLIEF